MRSGAPKPLILFHTVGTVHIRNLKILQSHLPEFDPVAVFQATRPWFSTKAARDSLGVPYRCVDGHPDENLWKGDIKAVILSIATIDAFIIGLVEAAQAKRIPVIAIEEVHQLAVNDGRINNYILPVESLLVASPHERRGFIRLGHPAECVHATGWPFFAPEITDESPLREVKHATLILSCLKEIDPASIETREVREKLFSAARHVCDYGYRLRIKAHPNESEESIREWTARLSPDAQILSPHEEIGDVLRSTDLIIIRGNTQVAIETLLHRVPIAVVPCGVRTIFHGTPVECETEETFIRFLQSPPSNSEYESIFAMHIPILPEEAARNAAERIRQVAEGNIPDPRPDRATQLVAYRTFLGEYRHEADRALIATDAISTEMKDAFIRLIEQRARVDDMRLLRSRYEGTSLFNYLKAFWIVTMTHRTNAITDPINSELLSDFPPKENAHHFPYFAALWIRLLIKAGEMEKAVAFAKNNLKDFLDDPIIKDALSDLNQDG
jgi:hypothetical protein